MCSVLVLMGLDCSGTFRQALKLLKGDPAQLVREIVAAMEACPPVDIASARSL